MWSLQMPEEHMNLVRSQEAAPFIITIKIDFASADLYYILNV